LSAVAHVVLHWRIEPRGKLGLAVVVGGPTRLLFGAILPKRAREARPPALVPPAGRVLAFTEVTLWPARLPSYSSKTTTTIFASIQRFSRTPATTCSRQLTVRRGWRSRGAVSRT